MAVRQEPLKIYGRFDKIVDDKGQIIGFAPTDRPEPPPPATELSGWRLTLQLTWDALFRRSTRGG